MAGLQPRWRLDGSCMMVFYLASSRRMAAFVPAPLAVQDLLPGVTLAGIYAAAYGGGEFGALREFSVFPALVRYRRRRGLYVPCSMVERRETLFGEKGAWGLKKEAARFHWNDGPGGTVLRVECNGQEIVEVRVSPRRVSVPMRCSFAFFHVRGSGVVSYHADYAARVHLAASRVRIPERSPLAAYALRHKFLTTLWRSTKIALHPPESEKVVIPRGVSEGIFQVPGEPLEPCGADSRVLAPPGAAAP